LLKLLGRYGLAVKWEVGFGELNREGVESGHANDIRSLFATRQIENADSGKFERGRLLKVGWFQRIGAFSSKPK
jgi:hypothetical protein